MRTSMPNPSVGHAMQRQVHMLRPLAFCMPASGISRNCHASMAAQRRIVGSRQAITTFRSNSSSLAPGGAIAGHQYSAAAVSRRRCRRAAAVPPLAMINVDFASPSLVLGIALIGCGMALLQVRNLQREVSRDADIVVAAMISIVGSTLIFQGWRLDPLLLLCQALTTSVAFWYGLEAFKLRQQVVEEEEEAGIVPPAEGFSNQMTDTSSYTTAQRPGFLPPAADRPLPPWQQQQQQPPMQGMTGPGSRWGLPPADPSLQFDYYAGQMGPPESVYTGYEAQQQQQPLGFAGQQQQQPSGLGYGSSSGYDAAGLYAQQSQPQQQQQYNMPQQPAQQYGADQWNWYGAGELPPAAAAYGQPQQQLPPEVLAAQQQQQQFNPAVGSSGMLDDGTYGAAAARSVPLPPAGQQQQLQRRRLPGGSSGGNSSTGQAYEQVDDWE